MPSGSLCWCLHPSSQQRRSSEPRGGVSLTTSPGSQMETWGGWLSGQNQDHCLGFMAVQGSWNLHVKRNENQVVTQPVPLDDTKESSSLNKQSQSCGSQMLNTGEKQFSLWALLVNRGRPNRLTFKCLSSVLRTKVFSRQGEDTSWSKWSLSRKFPCKIQNLNHLFAFLVFKQDTKSEKEKPGKSRQLPWNYKHNSERAAEFLCKTRYKAWQFSVVKITQSKVTTHRKLSSSNSEFAQ